MPSYSYVCEKCGNIEHWYLSINRRNEPKYCSKCGKLVTRLVGTGAVMNLKGDGFYKEGVQ